MTLATANVFRAGSVGQVAATRKRPHTSFSARASTSLHNDLGSIANSPDRARTAVTHPVMERVSRRADEIEKKFRMDKNVHGWDTPHKELAKYSYFRHPGLKALAEANQRNQKDQAVSEESD